MSTEPNANDVISEVFDVDALDITDLLRMLQHDIVQVALAVQGEYVLPKRRHEQIEATRGGYALVSKLVEQGFTHIVKSEPTEPTTENK